MVHAKAIALLLGISIGALVAQVEPDSYEDDPESDDPSLEDMIAARAVQERAVQVDQDELSLGYIVYNINGEKLNSSTSGYNTSLPYSVPGLVFTDLNFEDALTSPWGGMETTHASSLPYGSIPLENRSSNNLGGMGPNNGVYVYNLDTLTLQPSGYQAHPNFIRMNDVANYKGQRIAMRIDNTSEYLAAKPAMNDFNGFNFQINLKPLYNISAQKPGSPQPFHSDDSRF